MIIRKTRCDRMMNGKRIAIGLSVLLLGLAARASAQPLLSSYTMTSAVPAARSFTVSETNLLIVILVEGVAFLLTIGGFIIYQARLKHRHNQATARNIRKLMYYRDLVLKQEEKEEQTDETVQNGEQETDPEKLRFDEMDRLIMKDELFRNPNFGREELMRLMRVDKNTLATIIQRYTGTNVVGYINGKRMEYAVVLMKEHPEYTLAAIAEACGIKSPATFIRNFRSTYNLAPSEYRKTLEELPPTKGGYKN